MATADRFPILRRILAALGLSAEAIDDIVERILDWLSTKDEPATGASDYPFRRREDFLSPAELSFYRVLLNVVDGRAHICPKVGLGDLFFAETGDRQKNCAFANRIDRKHVDYVLCETTTMRPLLGLELDDRSHQRQDRKQRDELVEGVFAAAGLPLVRVAVKAGYPPWELDALLAPHLGQQAPSAMPIPAVPRIEPKTALAPAGEDAAAMRACPKCGGRMRLRTARSGAKAGGQFWGCGNFPKCQF